MRVTRKSAVLEALGGAVSEFTRAAGATKKQTCAKQVASSKTQPTRVSKAKHNNAKQT